MEDQQLDLLRVGRLALRAAQRNFSIGDWRSRFARALEEMHYSTNLSLETCEGVMEQLARQARQQDYESDCREICSAVAEIHLLQKRAKEGDVTAHMRLKEKEARHGL